MKLSKETKIKYYKEDITRWETYLNNISEPDILVEDLVNKLKEAIKYLESNES